MLLNTRKEKREAWPNKFYHATVIFMTYLLLFTGGLLTGTMSSFFGVGGAIVAVPLLLTLLPSTPTTVVVGTTLSMVLVNSCLTLYRYKDNIPSKDIVPLLKSYLPSIPLGLTAGLLIRESLSPDRIRLILGVFVVCLALKNSFDLIRGQRPGKGLPLRGKALLITALSGLLGGLLAAVTGLGGGVIYIPTYLMFFKIDSKQLPFYSAFPAAIGALLGTIGNLFFVKKIPSTNFLLHEWTYGRVNLAYLLLLSLGALISSKWGKQLNNRLGPLTLKKLFTALLFLMGGKIILTL